MDKDLFSGISDFKDYQALLDLYEQMIGDVEIEKVLAQTTKVVGRALNADTTTIYLVLKDTHQLQSVATVGNIAKTIKVPISSKSLSGYCALTGKMFIVDDAYDDLSYIDPNLSLDKSWDKLNNYRTKDVITIPVKFKGEILGVIQVINKIDGIFSEDDLLKLIPISKLVGYALYHAQLYDELSSLKFLNKEKAQFMKIMVHELKSPVAASKMITSTLKYLNKDNQTMGTQLEKVDTRLDQMLGMIGDILTLSEIRSGNPLGEIGVLNLVPDLHSIVKNYEDLATNKGLQYEYDIKDDNICVRIDHQGFNLIASNLISNGVKYTNEGFVKIELYTEGRCCVLKVSDSGIGIPEKDIPKLFNEFFRASNARASEIEGTGVGLAGIKDMVERFNGRMELESKENEGSIFYVKLPLVE